MEQNNELRVQKPMWEAGECYLPRRQLSFKHLLRSCSVTAKRAEMLLYDGHPAECQEKSNAHSLLFRIHWDRTAANIPRIPTLEAPATSTLSSTAKLPPQSSSHKAQSFLGKHKALNQPPEENVKHTTNFTALALNKEHFLALLLFCFYFFSSSKKVLWRKLQTSPKSQL